MTKLTRRQFGGMTLAAAAALSSRGASAQGSGMSFTYAEDPNRPFVQKMLDGFGSPVEVIGSAWGDVQKNILLRQRSKTLPASAQIQERWLPSLASLPELANLDEVIGKSELAAAFEPSVLAMGQA